MDSKKLRLVTRADDAGSCMSANSAILQTVRDGAVRNISVMVPGPAFQDAADQLRQLHGVAFGLHVTLNAEWDRVKWGPVLPASKVPSLVDENGHFTASPQMLHERGADLEQMIAEVEAQLDAARRAGLEISYLDEHMGISWLPGLREALADLARREGLYDANAVRNLTYTGGADRVSAWIEAIDAAPPGDYVLVLHPGMGAADMDDFVIGDMPRGRVAAERNADRLDICSPQLAEALRLRGILPARYPDLA